MMRHYRYEPCISTLTKTKYSWNPLINGVFATTPKKSRQFQLFVYKIVIIMSSC